MGLEKIYQTGDILLGGKGKVLHPMVYLDLHNSESFIGVMLTHDSTKKNNTPLKKEHIKEFDNNKKKFYFQYDNTYFLRAKLKKKADWGPYKKVGELTKEGVLFISEHIKKETPQYWNEIPSFVIKLDKGR